MSRGSFFRHQHPTNVLLRPAEALQKLFFRLNGILSYEMTAFMLCASTTQILRSLFRLWKGEREKKGEVKEKITAITSDTDRHCGSWYQKIQRGKISCQTLPAYKCAADSICVHLCVCLSVRKSLYLHECSSFNDNVHTKIKNHLVSMQQEHLLKLIGSYKWHIIRGN